VMNNETKSYAILKIPKESFKETIIREANLMKEIDGKLAKNPHLSHFLKLVNVSFGDRRIDSILISPHAVHGVADFSLEDIVNLASALFALHSANFVHRDISPQNISHYRLDKHETCPFIFDFGFSLSYTTGEYEEHYSGSIITASDEVLKTLSSGAISLIFRARDDLESLLKTFFIIITGRKPRVQRSDTLSKKAESVFEFWNYHGNSLFRSHINPILDSPNYEKISDAFWLSNLGRPLQLQLQGTHPPSPEANTTEKRKISGDTPFEDPIVLPPITESPGLVLRTRAIKKARKSAAARVLFEEFDE